MKYPAIRYLLLLETVILLGGLYRFAHPASFGPLALLLLKAWLLSLVLAPVTVFLFSWSSIRSAAACLIGGVFLLVLSPVCFAGHFYVRSLDRAGGYNQTASTLTAYFVWLPVFAILFAVPSLVVLLVRALQAAAGRRWNG
jgi:hypothetical protein